MGNENSTPTRPPEDEHQAKLEAARQQNAQKLKHLKEKSKRDKAAAESKRRAAEEAAAEQEAAALLEAARAEKAASELKRRRLEAEREAEEAKAAQEKSDHEEAPRTREAKAAQAEHEEARRTREAAEKAKAKQLEFARKLSEQRAQKERQAEKELAAKKTQTKEIEAAAGRTIPEDNAVAKRVAEERRERDAAAKTEAERIREENEKAAVSAALHQRKKAAQYEIARATPTSVGPPFGRCSEEGEIRGSNRSTPTSIYMPVRQSKPAQRPDTLAGWNARKQRNEHLSDSSRSPSDYDSIGPSKRLPCTHREDSKGPLYVPDGSESPPRELFPEKLAAADTTEDQNDEQSEFSFHGASSRKSSSSVKRPIPSSGFEDDRRRPAAKYQKRVSDFGVSSASPKSPIEPSGSDIGVPDDGTGQRAPPVWYSNMAFKGSRDSGTGGADTLLQRLKDQISKIKKLEPREGWLKEEAALDDLRTMLHKIAFLEVNAKLVRNHRMLDNKSGLPQIFDQRYAEGVYWPFDIKADSKELYHRWCSRIWEVDLLRGIVPGKPKAGKSKKGDNRASDSFKPGYRTISAKYHGNGNLLNGQWWPTQLTTLRDGAHGSSQGGIYGDTGRGAYSVIMAGGLDSKRIPYPDKDDGDVVFYCGTDSEDGKVTAYTQRLLESASQDPKQPVRLIRSHNLKSLYSPEIGFRYDGLYDVVDVQRMDRPYSVRQRHRFKLVRRPGQDPIRGGDGPQRRPTEEEVEAYKKDKRLRGYGS